jgi:hypothetical protein
MGGARGVPRPEPVAIGMDGVVAHELTSIR